MRLLGGQVSLHYVAHPLLLTLLSVLRLASALHGLPSLFSLMVCYLDFPPYIPLLTTVLKARIVLSPREGPSPAPVDRFFFLGFFCSGLFGMRFSKLRLF